MNAFITGSRAYGKPRKNSDVDLVVLVDDATKNQLTKLSDTPDLEEGKKYIRVAFGRLNLVVTTDPTEFAVWQVCTKQMQINAADGVKSSKKQATSRIVEMLETVEIVKYYKS